MKTNSKVIALSLVTMMASTGVLAAEKTFNIGGDAEYDITTRKQTNSANTTTRRTYESGRVKLNVKARIDNDHGSFVEAVVQPLFSYNDGKNNATDDTYIKFGRKAWDVQFGRFEGIDLAPAGKDTVAHRADDSNFGYAANKVRGRDDHNRIHGAAHFNLRKSQLELGVMHGANQGTKATGVRPVYKFDAGRFRVAVGYDWLECKNSSSVTSAGTNGCSITGTNTAGSAATKTRNEGFGVTLGTKVGMVDGNFNVAQGKSKTGYVDGSSNSGNKMTSIGINGTVRGFGAGYVHDKTSNIGKQDLLYAAYTVPLMGSKDATVTFAASTSKAKYDDSTKSNAKDTSLRMRMNYAF